MMAVSTARPIRNHTRQDVRAAKSAADAACRRAGFKLQPEAPLATPATKKNAANGNTYEHITIDGTEAFKAAVHHALDLLRPLPSWRYTAPIKRIVFEENESTVGYWVESTKTCVVGPKSAFQSTSMWLASLIAHEGGHGCDPNKRRETIDDVHKQELFAFTAQRAALLEMGATDKDIALIDGRIADPLGHYSQAQLAHFKGYSASAVQATAGKTTLSISIPDDLVQAFFGGEGQSQSANGRRTEAQQRSLEDAYPEDRYPGIRDFDYDYDRWASKRAADYAVERKAYLAHYMESLFRGYPEFAADLRKTGKIADILTSEDFSREYTKWTDNRYAEDRARLDRSKTGRRRSASTPAAATARYEHLAIEGSEAFVAAVRQSLDLLRSLPSWRYMAGLKRIAADDSDSGWYCARTRTCFIGPTVAHERNSKYLASFIVHEGAHGLDPSPRKNVDDLRTGEVVAFTAQLAALRELNACQTDVTRCEECLANPLGHYTADEITALLADRRSPKVVVVMLIILFVLAYFVGGTILIMSLR